MRDIELPPAHNQRANAMWAIIEPSVRFEYKSVIDLGCGYGDMMWRAWRAGAKRVMGLDGDAGICDRVRQSITGGNFWVVPFDLNKIDREKMPHSDIAICFSVLPYLIDPNAMLHWIREHSVVALLEVQYAGDGPGFAHIRDDDDMRAWLHDVGWQSVETLGRTHAQIRDAWRTIWRCE